MVFVKAFLIISGLIKYLLTILHEYIFFFCSPNLHRLLIERLFFLLLFVGAVIKKSFLRSVPTLEEQQGNHEPV